MIDESDNEYVLTAEVFTDISPFFTEVPLAPEEPPTEQEVEPDTFEFPVASEPPAIPDEVIPAETLTPFEQRVIDAVLAGDMGHFAPAFITADGAWDYDLWSAASRLANDLVNNGVAAADYAATATDWFLA